MKNKSKAKANQNRSNNQSALSSEFGSRSNQVKCSRNSSKNNSRCRNK